MDCEKIRELGCWCPLRNDDDYYPCVGVHLRLLHRCYRHPCHLRCVWPATVHDLLYPDGLQVASLLVCSSRKRMGLLSRSSKGLRISPPFSSSLWYVCWTIASRAECPHAVLLVLRSLWPTNEFRSPRHRQRLGLHRNHLSCGFHVQVLWLCWSCLSPQVQLERIFRRWLTDELQRVSSSMSKLLLACADNLQPGRTHRPQRWVHRRNYRPAHVLHVRAACGGPHIHDYADYAMVLPGRAPEALLYSVV